MFFVEDKLVQLGVEKAKEFINKKENMSMIDTSFREGFLVAIQTMEDYIEGLKQYYIEQYDLTEEQILNHDYKIGALKED